MCIRDSNGIEKEPAVLVESGSDQSVWMASDTWPPKGWEAETFPISETGEGMIVDDLSSTVYDRSADNLGAWLDELVLNDDAEYKNRMKYIWDPFAEKGTSAPVSYTHLSCRNMYFRQQCLCLDGRRSSRSNDRNHSV